MKAVVEMASKLGLRKTMASGPPSGTCPTPTTSRPSTA